MSVESIFYWTFLSKTDKYPEDLKSILVEEETIKAAYKTVRDIAVFTNKRLILRDSQGLTGAKVEIYSIPYSSINMYSTENSKGVFDFNSEIELWTRAGHFKINLKKGIDIRELDKLIAQCILK